MNEHVLFTGSLVISLGLHVAAALALPFVARTQIPLIQQTIEVAYQGQRGEVAAERIEPLKRPDLSQSRRPSPVNDDVPLKKNEQEITSFIQENLIKNLKTQTPPKPYPEKEAVERSVSMPNIPGEMQKSPEYRSYYSNIRDRIRRYAYILYRRLDEGEIFLTFTLASDGTVRDVTVVDARSANNPYLREIARRSILDSAPYPAFPEKLKGNRELSFNVIIAFELR